MNSQSLPFCRHLAQEFEGKTSALHRRSKLNTIPVGLCYDCGFMALTLAPALRLPAKGGNEGCLSGRLVRPRRASTVFISTSASAQKKNPSTIGPDYHYRLKL